MILLAAILADLPQVPQVSDPTAMILGGAGAIISTLSGIVVTMLIAQAKAAGRKLDSLTETINQMSIAFTEAKGKIRTLEAEVTALKTSTLTREIFERATGEQNAWIDEIKQDGKDTARKVDKLDRAIVARPWSQGSMPAVRPPLDRKDPDSDPPPMRRRSPSRPGE